MGKFTWIMGLSVLLGMACASPAHADEYGYLYELHAVGITVVGDVKMLDLADGICSDLRDGATVYDIAAALTQPGSPFSAFQSAEIIYASVDQVCPIYKGRAIAQVGGTGSIF